MILVESPARTSPPRLYAARAVPTFFLPLTFLHFAFEGRSVEAPPFTLTKRWALANTYDLWTLGDMHRLHGVRFEAIAMMLEDVHCELAVSGNISHLEAVDMARSFRAALYGQHISPSVVPFVSTHSVMEFAGLVDRETPELRAEMTEEELAAVSSDKATVDVWPMELYPAAWRLYDRVMLTEKDVQEASVRAMQWREMSARQKSLAALERALVASALIAPVEQAILHLWTAIEALFPKVSTEVVFRLALYVAQLVEGPRGGDRRAYARRVRNGYTLRSGIAHGSVTGLDADSWIDPWDIACDLYNAIQVRGGLPTEDELEDEALG